MYQRHDLNHNKLNSSLKLVWVFNFDIVILAISTKTITFKLIKDITINEIILLDTNMNHRTIVL